MTLFEQRAELGGDMIYEAEPPEKDKISGTSSTSGDGPAGA